MMLVSSDYTKLDVSRETNLSFDPILKINCELGINPHCKFKNDHVVDDMLGI